MLNNMNDSQIKHPVYGKRNIQIKLNFKLIPTLLKNKIKLVLRID